MRVLVRVAVTGKVLAAGNDPTVAQALDPALAEGDHFLRVGSERTVADYGIFWIRVDIQDRCEVEIDSHRGQFFSRGARGFVRKIGVVGRTNARCGREVSERLGKPMNSSAFLIDGDEGWMGTTGFPERSAQGKNLRGDTTIVAKENEATEGIMFDGD